jgi:hypothetical protein
MNKAQVSDSGQVLNIGVFGNDSIDESWVEYTDANPAYIGGDYIDGYFYPPQPFTSWLRDGSGNWLSPVPVPDAEGNWEWNEELQEWED